VLVYGQEIMMWKRKIAASTVYHSKTHDHAKEEVRRRSWGASYGRIH
jgi:hypothetical protein